MLTSYLPLFVPLPKLRISLITFFVDLLSYSYQFSFYVVDFTKPLKQ
jgi:hypothetical protein